MNYKSDSLFQFVSMSLSLLFSVITGKLTALTTGASGSMQATVSLIKAYKAGSLTITQAGETMSVKLFLPCKKCPFLRRGIWLHMHIITNLCQIPCSLFCINFSHISQLLIYCLFIRSKLYPDGSGG